jgi:hypothetical protein
MATEAQIVAVATNLKKLAIILGKKFTVGELVDRIKSAVAKGDLSEEQIDALACGIWSDPRH